MGGGSTGLYLRPEPGSSGQDVLKDFSLHWAPYEIAILYMGSSVSFHGGGNGR